MLKEKHPVKFIRGTQASWEQLLTTPEKIDKDALYFIYEDSNYSTISKLYLGNKLISDSDILDTITLNDLNDIQINEELLANNQILVYNAEDEKWENISLSDIIDLTDYYTKTEIDQLIPTKTSDLTNDNNFINSLIANELIASAISNISTLRFEIVQGRPTEDIQENVIYLILKNNSDENNTYEEWIYVNNKWELIGTTDIDLSQYQSKIFIENHQPYCYMSGSYIKNNNIKYLQGNLYLDISNNNLYYLNYITNININNGKIYDWISLKNREFYYNEEISQIANNQEQVFDRGYGIVNSSTFQKNDIVYCPSGTYKCLSVQGGQFAINGSSGGIMRTYQYSWEKLNTNYYTKNEINNISTLSFEIAQNKPNENIQTNKIYLIPKQNSENENIYEEWIYINENWELIGATDIDLSQYYNKNEINNFLNQKVDITTTVAGLALDDNIQAQELKENLDIYPIVPTSQGSEGSGIAYYPNVSSETYLSLKVGDIFQCRFSDSVRLYFKESSDNYKTILDSDLLSYEIVRRLGDYNISDDSYIMKNVSSSNSLWNCEKGDIIIGKNNVYFLQNCDSNGYNKTLYWKKLLTIDDIEVKENISNKVTSLSAESTDEEYPSAKAVYDAIENISLTPGPAGSNGASAYQIAVNSGYQGTEQQWLASLIGAQGPQGIQGETGAQGVQGSTGADGKSAYQIAVDNGFVGTQQEWLASLVGATGQTGAQGPAGADGADWVPTQQELNNIASRVINLLPNADEEAY